MTRIDAHRKFDLLSDYERSVYYKNAAFLKERYLNTTLTDYELARNIYVNRLMNEHKDKDNVTINQDQNNGCS